MPTSPSKSAPLPPPAQGMLLIVEDNEAYRKILERSLARRGFAIHGTGDADEALVLASVYRPEFVLLDLNLAGRSGLALIQPLLTLCPQSKVVMLTGYASIPTTVAALKLGAAQFLAKPVEISAIVKALLEDEVEVVDFVPEKDLMTIRIVEWEHIQRVLAANNGNITNTARALKMHRRTLQRKLNKHREQNGALVLRD